ncbi:MAG: ABC transporter ATP-binding protein [Chloroflexota bacterium]
MSDIAIQVENLSKRYRIGKAQLPADGKRSLLRKATTPFRYLASTLRSPAEDEILWALKDISFEVRYGEVIGIIGRNGAGKSTLLKILSRITEPTSGHAMLNGRVGSLLEVGTGFHPELTGRENIYLNGAILGMQRKEIEQKFDEIVDFAEIEKFLDTPVKRYSSGMYVRLAFAVAAHLEPEILLVDEVLAVGDAVFQKKCIGKMDDVAKQGRTILFVSHNIAALLSLCPTSYLIHNGQIITNGETTKVVNRYLVNAKRIQGIALEDRKDRNGNGVSRFTSIGITNSKDALPIKCSDGIRITLGYKSSSIIEHPAFLIGIYDQLNQCIFFLDSRLSGWLPEQLPDSGQIVCSTEPLNLTPGICKVNIALYNNDILLDHVVDAYELNIEPDDFYGTGRIPERQRALCLLHNKWQYLEMQK